MGLSHLRARNSRIEASNPAIHISCKWGSVTGRPGGSVGTYPHHLLTVRREFENLDKVKHELGFFSQV